MSISSRLRAAAAGAALMWFLDPAEGQSRRSAAAARMRGARRVVERVGETAIGERIAGRVADLRHRHDEDDDGDLATHVVETEIIAVG